MNSGFRYTATVLSDGNIEEVDDILGKVTKGFINVRAATREKAIRDALIKLGWTPPPEQNHEA